VNRREAIAVLVALPGVARISAAPVKSTDVIVVECDEYLSREAADYIRAQLTDVWPGQKIVVLGRTMRLKVVEGA
jgi:hypothetical protein